MLWQHDIIPPRHKLGTWICNYSRRTISTSPFLHSCGIGDLPITASAAQTSYLSRGVIREHDSVLPYSRRHNTITDPRVAAIRISGSSTLFFGGEEVAKGVAVFSRRRWKFLSMNECESRSPFCTATEFFNQYQDGEKCINMIRYYVQK